VKTISRVNGNGVKSHHEAHLSVPATLQLMAVLTEVVQSSEKAEEARVWITRLRNEMPLLDP
jgi:hypothetical protein